MRFANKRGGFTRPLTVNMTLTGATMPRDDSHLPKALQGLRLPMIASPLFIISVQITNNFSDCD